MKNRSPVPGPENFCDNYQVPVRLTAGYSRKLFSRMMKEQNVIRRDNVLASLNKKAQW